MATLENRTGHRIKAARRYRLGHRRLREHPCDEPAYSCQPLPLADRFISMLPCTVISFMCLLAGALGPLSARAADAVIVVQRSPLAGLRHYEAGTVWRELREGDRLELVREPDNPYDASAVRIEWRGRKLGYLPRRDNMAVARQLDRGAALEAKVARLKENRNRSVRLEFEVVAPLANP